MGSCQEGLWCALVLASWVIIIQGANSSDINGGNSKDSEARAVSNANSSFLQSLLSGMDPRIKPATTDGRPVIVKCGLFIASFSEVSEVSMDFKIGMYFREIWTDPRLMYNTDEGPSHLSLSSKAQEQIWIPDIYFPNEKDAKFHDITVPNTLMKIYPNGTVIYSVRLTLTLACPMNLAAFPMDTQTCFIKIESYAYEIQELELEWMDTAVDIDEELELPQFDFYNVTFGSCLKNYKTTGTFPCLKASFQLHRLFGFFLLQTYVPSILIIILSWVSFWINMDAVPARITLGVTTVLTMTTQLSGTKASIPKVSYPKAIDVWMSTGMVFVFAALIEYAIVNALSRQSAPATAHKKDDDDDNDCKMPLQMEMTGKEDPESHSNNNPTQSGRRKPWENINHRKLAEKVDVVSRFLFPGAFIIFNIVYWPMFVG